MRAFERVDSVEEIERGLLASLHGEQLRIEVVRDDVVRFKLSRGGVFDESPTFAVCVDPLSQPVEYTVDARRPRGSRPPRWCVTLWLDPFRLDVHRPDGSVVVESVDRRTRRSTTPSRSAAAAARRTRSTGSARRPGAATARDATSRSGTSTSSTRTRRASSSEAARAPRADRRSTEFDPYYVSIPFFYHHAHIAGTMAASFVDNGYRGHYDFRADDEYAFRFEGGQYTEYVFAGPSMPAILAAYTWLTGRTAPPPLWALGYHQCRWFDYTQDAVEALGARHRELDVPCDALWLDIEYMDGYRVFTWDKERVPGRAGIPRAAAPTRASAWSRSSTRASSTSRATRSSTTRWSATCCAAPRAATSTSARSGRATPRSRTSSPRRPARWWGELNAAHVASGLAGIWNDMNEPATGMIPAERMRFDRGRASHARYHNQYALLMAMGTRDGLLAAMPDLRTFILSRAGFAGIQRYAANWMGDNMSRWDHLELSLPMAAGLGVSGQAFVGADIGGFAGHSNAELFLRWMQMGTLTPFCRNHSEIDNADQYAWAWGDVILDARARRDRAALPAAAVHLHRVRARVRDRRAGPAAAGLRSPVRRRRARPRRPVPVRARPARRAGGRRRRHRAPGLPARGRLVRLAHGRALRRPAAS